MHLTGIDLVFWLVGFVANAGLLTVLVYRRRAERFPFFAALITLNVTRTIVLFLVLRYSTKDCYFYSYWSLTVLDTILQLCVVYEVASQVFRPLHSWAHEVRKSFVWLLVLSLSIAFFLTWLASPPVASERSSGSSSRLLGNEQAAKASPEMSGSPPFSATCRPTARYSNPESTWR